MHSPTEEFNDDLARLAEDARALLGSFLFKKDDIHKKTGVLSGKIVLKP